MAPHVLARPAIDRGGAADRLRNHLRRRAITRPGLIEGDLYFLPFWRASGEGPQGETSFHLLAAEVGDSRLFRANLPPADLRPFDHQALPSGAVMVAASIGEAALASRARTLGWNVTSLEELIHYPFWLMKVEDSCRFEGAWLDGVEGKIIHHTLRVPEPIPSVKRTALHLAAPAAFMAGASLLFEEYWMVALTATAVAAAVFASVGWTLKRAARQEREG